MKNVKIKLNVGASPIWEKNDWHKLDHKIKQKSEYEIPGDASNILLENKSVSTIFCSHMIEHIPHTKLERILLEFNRVLVSGGILRIQVPDLLKITKAYVTKDLDFFEKARLEDESIRTDLGLGGMFMNFIVSPGQDTALFDRNLKEFIGGYAHIYAYDFEMLNILLLRTGFKSIYKKEFLVSDLDDYREPLHVEGLPPKWEPLNQDFYKKNNLKHYYDEKIGKYIIDFKLTGFDSCPVHSLIVEAKKSTSIELYKYESLNFSKNNYNHYAWSLLKDKNFKKKVENIKKL